MSRTSIHITVTPIEAAEISSQAVSGKEFIGTYLRRFLPPKIAPVSRVPHTDVDIILQEDGKWTFAIAGVLHQDLRFDSRDEAVFNSGMAYKCRNNPIPTDKQIQEYFV